MSQFRLIKAIDSNDAAQFMEAKEAIQGQSNFYFPIKEDLEDNISALERFSAKIRRAKKGFRRLVLRLSLEDFKTTYIPRGGHEQLAQSFSDAQIQQFAKNPENAVSSDGERTTKPEGSNTQSLEEIQVLPQNYKFSDIITTTDSALDISVLLDVPEALIAGLKNVVGDRPAAIKHLIKIIDHKHYIMAINNAKAKKIASRVQNSWDDSDDLVVAIDPYIVVAYPNKEEFATIVKQYPEAVKKYRQRASDLGSSGKSNNERSDASDDDSEDAEDDALRDTPDKQSGAPQKSGSPKADNASQSTPTPDAPVSQGLSADDIINRYVNTKESHDAGDINAALVSIGLDKGAKMKNVAPVADKVKHQLARLFALQFPEEAKKLDPKIFERPNNI